MLLNIIFSRICKRSQNVLDYMESRALKKLRQKPKKAKKGDRIRTSVLVIIPTIKLDFSN